MKKIPLYAYYFPNWHVDALNEKWHGRGWTEWEVLKCARPRFEGHEQPTVPLWGYEDEADPRVMEKKIATAKRYGIDGFIFDTYYFDDGPYRTRCLDEGFLQAENCEELDFAVMWCNHDSIYAHPSPRNLVSPVLKSGKVSREDFVRITDVFLEKYFSRPNYIRVDGKILFIVYNVVRLSRDFGGTQNVRAAFDDLRDRVRKAGLGEMAIGCHVPEVLGAFGDRETVNRFLKELGIDEGVRYWWPTRHCDDPRFEEYTLTVNYSDYVDAGLDRGRADAAFFDVPVNLNVCCGLDNSPRTIQSETYENLECYPWGSIVVGRSLKEYERALRETRALSQSADYRGHFITFNSWNEWTEGNYLEPDTVYGYGFLECIRKIFKERT